ncbi:MAG TPA: transglycosylase SLT domain-containing protein [Zeimonas sp.]
MTNRIAIAAIVGLIGLSILPAADAQKRRPDAPAAEVSATLDIDESFLAAHEAFTRNDPLRFEAMAAQARSHPLSVYLDYWRLRLRLQAPAGEAVDGAADADVQRFLARHEGSLVADLLSRDWMLDLGRRGEWHLFDAEYAKWILRDDDEAHCYASLGKVVRGMPAPQARSAVFSLRSFGPGCTALLDAQLRTHAFGHDDLVERLLVALETNSSDVVRLIGERLGLDSRRVDVALSNPTKALAGKRTREVTLIALSRLARKDPAEAMERLDASAPALREADAAFVRSQVAASSMRRLDARALEWARASLDAPATDVTWTWLARAALRAQDWTTLRKVVARMSPAGRSEPAWVYWSARAERERGNAAKADEMLRPIAGQFTFYGQLAAEDLGSLTAPPPAPLATTREELAQAARNAGFDRALRFYALGLRFEGNREWNFQLRGMSDRQLLAAARWACDQQVLDRCVNTADRTREQHDFALRFVSPFLDRMKPVAANADLDPAWVYGLIRQESRFIMDARSWAGAQGLMQIMPATARWVAKKLGERDFRVEQLHDLDTNLRYGTFYLRTVLDDLDGSPLLASAAYNAGPRRPRNWRSTLSAPVEGAIFAEIIPFNETRDYVKKVLTNAVYYAALFTGRPQSLKARLGTVGPTLTVPTDIP